MGFTVNEDERSELATVWAILALYDDKAPITPENISKIVKAAGIEVEPFWPKLFAQLLEGRDVADLLVTGGGGGPGPAGPAAGGAAATGGAAAAPKEEPKKEEPEEEDEDMGFSLFD